MKRNSSSIIFFILCFFLTLLNAFGNNDVKFPYEGLSTTVSGEGYGTLVRMYNDENRYWLYRHEKIPLLKKEEIIASLQNNFMKMVEAYQQNKSKLPHCLQEAFDRFLNDIKTKGEDGKPKAEIEWDLTKSSQGNPAKYNKDYLDIFYQDFENGYYENIDGKEVHHEKKSNCDGTRPVLKDNSNEVNDEKIDIDGAYKDQCQAVGEFNGQIYKNVISTPSIMFHEFTHLMTNRYPELFENLDLEHSEVSTEAFTSAIFGDAKTNHFYRDVKYKDTADKIKDLCNLICKDKSKCPKKDPKPPKNDDNDGNGEENSSQFGDQPDDNFSYFEGNIKYFDLAPKSVILTKGNWREAVRLLGGLRFDGDSSAQMLLNITPLLIIPSGGLADSEYDSAFRYLLEQYVNLGGTVIVFTQQYDTHIENLVPVPEGENIDFVGWRQDQSCYHGSVYFKGMHPMLTSATGELVSGAVDGYFETWPSTSTVLLNRSKNREAAMLYYPYGNGTVILTSLYTDWGYAHSQATAMELRVVRDLITFAKNPHLPIPIMILAWPRFLNTPGKMSEFAKKTGPVRKKVKTLSGEAWEGFRLFHGTKSPPFFFSPPKANKSCPKGTIFIDHWQLTIDHYSFLPSLVLLLSSLFPFLPCLPCVRRFVGMVV